jgi:hypothetical protein
MARKGKGKGKTAYGLTEEEEHEDKDDPPENTEEEEWWVGAVCALSRDEGFVRVPTRRSARPQRHSESESGVKIARNQFAELADEERCDDEEGREDIMEEEPDASRVDVGDSTGRIPHTQGVRGTPTRKGTGAWRTSPRGEPACRPPRVGSPRGLSGGVDGAPAKILGGNRDDFKDKADLACSGFCRCDMKSFRNIGGEPFSHQTGRCTFGEDRKASTHARSATPAAGSPFFGEDRATSTHARRGTPPQTLQVGYVADLRSKDKWPKISNDIETRAMKRMRTAKLQSSDSGKQSHARVCNGKDLDLLIADAGMDRFVGAVAKDNTDGKMRIVEAVVDSGAEESVAPPGCFPGAVVPSRMSRAGGKYRAANGARIPNLGQQRVPFVNEDGGKCGILFQVAEVERPLISATQLAASGNSVIITGKGGKIVNDKTGKVMRLTRRGGVLVLKMRIPAESGPGFPGPGR